MPLFSKSQQLSLSNKGQPATPSSVPQKSSPSKQVVQKPISSKPAPAKPVFTKPAAPKPQKTIPQKPTTLFGEKKDWRRQDFISRVAKNPFSGGGRAYSSYERKKMLDKTFSPGRFSTYISEGEAKTRLRELRREEYRAKTGAEKSKISQTRKYIEKQTGLRGKY